MNLLSFLLSAPKNAKQVVSQSWSERNSILRPDVNLFCWKRTGINEITSYLKSCVNRKVQPVKFTTTIDDLPADLSQARSLWDPNHENQADAFWIDVYKLVSDFLVFSDTNSGTVHLKIIDNDACSKFHTDGYSLRLFTSYYGPGTEWLPEGATNRKGLGKSNELIVKDQQQIQRMKAFEVGILKGEIPGQHHSVKGIVHRSPQITDTGEKRIILRIDI